MEKLLTKDVETRRFCWGVFSCDNLPAHQSAGPYIVNEKLSHK